MNPAQNVVTLHSGLALKTFAADAAGIYRSVGHATVVKFAGWRKQSVRDFQQSTLIDDDLNKNASHLLVDRSGQVFDLRHRLQSQGKPIYASNYIDRMLTTTTGACFVPSWKAQPNPILDHIREQAIDEETLIFLITYLAASLRGDLRLKLLIFIVNPGKNSGKSNLMKILLLLFGDYVVKVPSSYFSRGRSEQLLKFLYRHRYARIIIVDELPRGMIPDVSVIRLLTGEDSLTSPYVNGTAQSWIPPRLIIFNTNELFDHEFREDELADRSFAIPYGVSVGPELRDPELVAKLATQDNLDVFFSCILEGGLNGRN